MKFLLVLLIATIAVFAVNCKSYGSRWMDDKDSNEFGDSSNKHFLQSASSSSSWSLGGRRSGLDSDESNENDDSKRDVERASVYVNKIEQRLNRSTQLKNKQSLKNRILEQTEEKLEKCMVRGAGENKVHRQCAGRVTAQMMQWIAASETMENDSWEN